MSRRRITKEELISRLKDKFSNEDGTLIELNNYEKVNKFLKEVRKVHIEYKIEGFDKDALNIYDDDNLKLEYYFRHQEYIDLSLVILNSRDNISRFINWCYLINMTEKNQIRKRLEFFDKDYISDQLSNNPGLTFTKIIRNYRYLYKDHGKKEEN